MRSREQVVAELLVLAAQAGDVDAFERLAVRWHPRLLQHAKRLTGDSEGAQEAVQEAWVAVARGLGQLKDPARFGPWAFRITSRRCADWIALRRRTRQRTSELDATAELPTPTDGTGDGPSRVREILRGFPPELRTLMAMFYVEGFSVLEVADALGVPVGTVKSRLFHARERLRTALEVSDGTQAQR
ncbi:MAG: sigma-70 family RNA polymerase sigma factor [Planctomycetota bacterium]|nr:MAG: sigma-70 family RNA polymerase sigma factor [Planctomycetota bacterium]